MLNVLNDLPLANIAAQTVATSGALVLQKLIKYPIVFRFVAYRTSTEKCFLKISVFNFVGNHFLLFFM